MATRFGRSNEALDKEDKENLSIRKWRSIGMELEGGKI